MKQCVMDSMIGKLYLVASEDALQAILWKKQPAPVVSSLDGKDPAVKILAQTVRELNEYFNGDRTSFEVPLDAIGTEFQKNVWNQLRRIPYGTTSSYREIASAIKNDKAVRAVGTANGRNPLSIIVPCHRVIAFDGSLAGYSGGVEIKKQLLDLEAASLKKHRKLS